MRILILSDSHGAIAPMQAAIAAAQPELLLHLGDHAEDADALRSGYPALRCLGVRGNCDPSGGPERLLLPLCNKKLLLVHGHRQQVKLGLDRLYFSALEAEADVVLFGHTHAPQLLRRESRCFLNPGAARDGCYAVLTLGEGEPQAELCRL